MLSPKQITVFGTFLREPYRERTYQEIKTLAHEKSNSVIQRAVAAFLRDGLVTKRSVGNNLLYKVNLSSPVVLAYFGLLAEVRLPRVASLSLGYIREELAGSFASVVVFGSYAEGKQTKDSDLDIAVFVESEAEKKLCERSLKAAATKAVLSIDGHVFTKDEMLAMLLDRQENLGKQIAKKHLAVHNQAIFYNLLADAIHRGFRPVPE